MPKPQILLIAMCFSQINLLWHGSSNEKIFLYDLLILSLLFVLTGCGDNADKTTVKEGKFLKLLNKKLTYYNICIII